MSKLLGGRLATPRRSRLDDRERERNGSRREKAERRKRIKPLTSKQANEILKYRPIEGVSIAAWCSALQRKDLERIANVVTRAAVEGLTVSKIAREIRGTKEGGYTDGILQTSRNGAVALARTVINGVSNNARIETIRENADAIDGARFVGTLDGKTCPHCGALDGTVWGPDELDQIRRPPLHVSCRCCVVPHVVLKGPDGKIYEIGSRPAANADFDALAKEAYNKAAREKGIKRRWDDLSPSTRLKYYYKAQKDFEKRTGKPAYRQVSPSTTFAEYFERQDDAFKRSWLGAKRYEAYRNGAKFGDVAKPATTYRATLPELPQTPGNGPISPSNASETPSTANDPPQAETSPQEPKIDRLTLPDFDGSPKQNAWAADLREKELDEWEAVALSERVKQAVEPAKSKRRFFYNAEIERQKDLVRAEMEKRGEAVVLAEMEAAAREIAAEIFANPSARDWIDGRGGPSVWARAINEARRRVATTGSAAKPKPAFDLPPLDLPPLSLPRLSGSPRQISWAEDLRRRAVRDLTEERANETIAPRDHVQRWRQWSTRRDAKKIRDELPELEKAIAEVGGDEAAALILGRETFLKARELVEAWDDSRDWIDLKTEQKIDLNAYAAQKIAGTPKEAAAILRRYAAVAKAQAPQTFGLAVGGSRKDKKSFLARWLPATDKPKINNDSDLPEYDPQEWQDEERYLAETKAEIAAFRKTSAAQDFKGVADFLRKKYNIDVSGLDKAPEIATIYTDGILDVMERFGDVGTLRRVKVVDSLSGGRIAQFTPETGEIEILRQTRQQLAATVKKEFEAGNWCSGDLRAVARHEMGHVVSAYLKSETFEKSIRPRFLRGLDSIKKEARKLPPEKWKSDYSFEKNEEFFAELIAAYFDGSLPQERQKQATEYITRLLNLTPLRG